MGGCKGLGGSGFRVTAAVHRHAARERHGVLLLAWVVMQEHVPLIVVPRAVGVPEILRAIKPPVAPRAINRWKGAPVLETIAVGERHRSRQAGGG
jgi:REP element-mobilizing transposase RayT